MKDQADSLLPITAIIDITEEKIRNVIAERAADQKIPSRDSNLASHFDARTSFPYESSAAPKHIAHRVSDGLEAFASADLAHLHDVVKDEVPFVERVVRARKLHRPATVLIVELRWLIRFH